MTDQPIPSRAVLQQIGHNEVGGAQQEDHDNRQIWAETAEYSTNEIISGLGHCMSAFNSALMTKLQNYWKYFAILIKKLSLTC